ncbi:MAG: alkaline phosphatase D family protein, partial [Burkholderiaceae bacterium]|nr:alkaline phosphatase D family protein [Burkholderiaceae bacterium]
MPHLPFSPARRRWLRLALAAALPQPWRTAAALPRPRLADHPFPLGVASGPAGADGVVLWTRVAPGLPHALARLSHLPLSEYLAARRTLEEAAQTWEVRWEVAADERFRKIVRRGTAIARPELGHSVHVELHGLVPGRWYHYRFLLGDAVSGVGRTRTAPVRAQRLRFALASCQHYEYGHFGAYGAMRADDPELVLFVGDYIYEGGPRERRFRPHPFPAARTLTDYRLRHALYKTDAALAAMHAHCPWLLTWDDHEVSNDYAGDFGEDPSIDGAARRAAAYQAYYEHMPLPAAVLVERFAHVRLYRHLDVGGLARFVVLDGRQYRDRQACPLPSRGGSRVVEDDACPERRDVARTLLGAQELAWLREHWGAAGARFDFLVQPTLFSQVARGNGARRFWTDGWDGYPAERARVTALLPRARNAVVLGGDVHTTYVCDVKDDFDDPRAAVIATEFCGTSITSPTTLSEAAIARLAAANAHVRYANGAQRGYLLAELTPQALTMRLRAADDVTQAQPRVHTEAAW